MLKFGIENLRRLKSVSPVEMKPITLLVGRNSSGKSTFLRSLPLFRQSLMTKTSSPILWYGDLVDFGSFDSSSGSKQKNDPIKFTFEIDKLTVNNGTNVYVNRNRIYDDEYEGISVTVAIVPFKERTRISGIQLTLHDWYETTYDLIVDENDFVSSIKINGAEALHEIEPYCIVVRSNSLFPELLIVDKTNAPAPGSIFPSFTHNPEGARFYKALNNVLRPHMDGRIRAEKINSLLVDMIVGGFPNRKYLRDLGAPGPAVLTGFLNNLTGKDTKGIYNSVSRILAVSALVPLVRTLGTRLKLVFNSTLYIGPARARSERYYRYQDLAVSEIDPDGKNLPIFLNSLSTRQLGNLSNWIKGLFGYGISISRERDHISINLIESGHQPNIVDVGYGVSQILPVLGQIWWARYQRRPKETRSTLTLLAIEQPELHLHPAHQALLADALVGMVHPINETPTTEQRVHYVVETHSETLVNRLGELVAEGRIDSEDVQMILFERNREDDRSTTTRTVKFDSDGTLIDWPYGFFQPAL